MHSREAGDEETYREASVEGGFTGGMACVPGCGELAIAQFPPGILADRYLVQAERELDTGDAAAAVETLSRIVALQAEHVIDIPDVFWFRRAEAAQEAGLQDLALESIIRYFDVSGQGGEHYLAALELYDAAELAKQVAAERAAAEAERAAVVAAAVAAAIPEMVEIPPGRFRMGCVSGQDCHESEFSVHDVTIAEGVRGLEVRGDVRAVGLVCVGRRLRRIPAERSGHGPRHPPGAWCVLAGCACLRVVVVVAHWRGLPLVERGGVGIRSASGD